MTNGRDGKVPIVSRITFRKSLAGNVPFVLFSLMVSCDVSMDWSLAGTKIETSSCSTSHTSALAVSLLSFEVSFKDF